MLTAGSTCTRSPPGCAADSDWFSGSEPRGGSPDMAARWSLCITDGRRHRLQGWRERREGQRVFDTFDTRPAVRWAGASFLFKHVGGGVTSIPTGRGTAVLHPE